MELVETQALVFFFLRRRENFSSYYGRNKPIIGGNYYAEEYCEWF
nr:MAG TPA: hypothetical protein [Caudoviricetes sp.]